MKLTPLLIIAIMIPNLVFCGDIYGIRGEGKVGEAFYSYNGSISQNISGDFDGTELINSSNNTILINGFAQFYTFHNSIYGGHSFTDSATNNNIILINSNVDAIYGAFSTSGSVSNNIIRIYGGNVGNIYGGDTLFGKVSNNTVEIYRGTVENIHNKGEFNTVNIFGGSVTNIISGGSTYIGNTLNIDTTRLGISSMNIGNINNFEFINFYLIDDIRANDTILNLNNYTNTDLTNSNIIVHINNTTLLNDGDIVHIIRARSNLTAPKSATLKINNGIVSVSNVSGDFFSISSDMKILDLNFTKNILASANIKVDESTKSFLESKLSQSIMISESANLLSENMDNISNLVATNSATGVDLSSFAFMGVGTKKYKTGSSIDQKAVSINAGVAKDFEFGWSGDFLGGAFLEFGASKYESELDNGFKNKGDAKFFGIGVFSKKMLKNDFYGIIGARIGQAMNKYEDEINAIEYKFDLSNLYYGLNLGGGKLLNLSSSNTLDIYTKYFFAHTNSNEENIGNGLSVEIDAVDSHQISLGAKDNIALDDKAKVYVGASVNYKFGGQSTGKLSSNAYGGIFTADIPSPALNGAYFGLDAGCKIAQSQNLNLSIGIKGYLGKEQGVGANLGVEYKF